MYRAAVVIVALTWLPSLAAAQQPCTTDANQVVAELYRHMLERSPDAGAAHWVQMLQSGRATVRDVVREIAKSPEHTQRFWRTEAGEETPYIRAVGTIYRHILGRQPDPAGARTWAEQGARSGVASVIDQITASPEYNNAFGDWGVPGSGGLRYCGSNNQGATATSGNSEMLPRFRTMDTNNDGSISRAEWQGNVRTFEAADWNNDGILSGDEVRPGTVRRGRAIDNSDFVRENRFENLDANGNDRIELREWNGTAANFDRLDVNNDNTLSRSELAVESTALGTSGDLVTVDPRNEWTDTGLTVRAGDTILFESDGRVQLSADPNDIAFPSGSQTGRRAASAPLSRASAGALIARIGNSNVSLIGDRRSWRAPSSGRLYLGVNDDYMEDNSGQFNVIVNVQPR
jgi:hypothetical protein